MPSPGGNSGPFSLSFYITEKIPDLSDAAAFPGDIGLSSGTVTLVPVGPGNNISGICVPDFSSVTGQGYEDKLKITCYFDDVPVNTYRVEADIENEAWHNRFERPVGSYFNTSAIVRLLIFSRAQPFTGAGAGRRTAQFNR